MPYSLPSSIESGTDKTQLVLRHWPLADSAQPAGVAVIVHGLGEHSGRYNHVAAHLNRWGWSVVSYDHRGHGQSGGGRGLLPTDSAFLSDLGQVLTEVRRTYPTQKLLLIGHSMGGLIAARYVSEALSPTPNADWAQPVDALVLSSPALDLGLNGFQKALLGSVGKLAPTLAVSNGLKPEWVCRDPDVVKAYVNDPLVHDRACGRLVNFMLAGGSHVMAQAPRWQVPTLLIYGGADRCVNPAGSARFAQLAPSNQVRSKAYAHMAHEIFNEPDQSLVFDDLKQWLDTLSL